MPFVKLDTGMLDSTLWIDREAREVFITALLMAEPRELKEAEHSLKPDALEENGFIVPAGWYGFVRAAGPGIVRRAMVESDTGMVALHRLSEPDPGSRSADFEGRRLARVDGGYLVLNYMKYRERDYTAAERMKRYRERKKETKLRRSVGNVHRNVTQAEAEAEAEAENLLSPASPSRSRKRERSQATPTPDDFLITEAMCEFATELGISQKFMVSESEKFLDHARANGRKCVNWKAAWRNWMRKAKELAR